MPVFGAGQAGIRSHFKTSPGSSHVSYTEARVFRHHPAIRGRRERPVRHIEIEKDQIPLPEFMRERQIGREICRQRILQRHRQSCREGDVAAKNAERRFRARPDPVAQQRHCANVGDRHRSSGPQHLRDGQIERLHQTIGPRGRKGPNALQNVVQMGLRDACLSRESSFADLPGVDRLPGQADHAVDEVRDEKP